MRVDQFKREYPYRVVATKQRGTFREGEVISLLNDGTVLTSGGWLEADEAEEALKEIKVMVTDKERVVIRSGSKVSICKKTSIICNKFVREDIINAE